MAAHVVLLNDLLVDSRDLGYSRYIAPYVLATKAREAGYECAVIENFTRLPNLHEVLAKVIGPETVMVGISGTFLGLDTPSERRNSRAIFEYSAGFLWKETPEELDQWLQELRATIRQCNSQAQVVLGGTKALFALQSPEMRKSFDFYVLGPAETFFDLLVADLVKKTEPPFRVYEGAKYLHTSFYGRNRPETVTTVRWSASDYIRPQESLPLELTKGCLYNCKFCNHEKQVSYKKTQEDLRDELIRNYEMFGTTVYHFCDDCFNDTRPKVEAFCNTFLSLPFKIDWVTYARVDVACRFPETLDLMVESGVRGIFWGLETFDYNVGKKIGKGTPPEKVKDMLINLKKKHGDEVISMGSFIIGLPGEKEETLRATRDWIIETRALDLVWYSPLGLRPYSEKLDKAVMDYADFSRNPQKYGFTKVSFYPMYWEHADMNSDRSRELKIELRDSLQEHNISNSIVGTIFQYPYLRSLGFSHAEVVYAVKHARWYGAFHDEVTRRDKLWFEQYSNLVSQQQKKPLNSFIGQNTHVEHA